MSKRDISPYVLGLLEALISDAEAGLLARILDRLPEEQNRKIDKDYEYCVTCNQIIDTLEADCFCTIHNLALNKVKSIIEDERKAL